MRKLYGFVGIALLGSIGCVNMDEAKLKELDARVVVKTSIPVSADQVNPDNAHEAIQQLWDELDHEAMTSARPTKTRK